MHIRIKWRGYIPHPWSFDQNLVNMFRYNSVIEINGSLKGLIRFDAGSKLGRFMEFGGLWSSRMIEQSLWITIFMTQQA